MYLTTGLPIKDMSQNRLERVNQGHMGCDYHMIHDKVNCALKIYLYSAGELGFVYRYTPPAKVWKKISACSLGLLHLGPASPKPALQAEASVPTSPAT